MESDRKAIRELILQIEVVFYTEENIRNFPLHDSSVILIYPANCNFCLR